MIENLPEGETALLNRDFIRRVRLLRGKEELITFRYTIGEDDRLVEHVTMEVPNSFLDGPNQASERETPKRT